MTKENLMKIFNMNKGQRMTIKKINDIYIKKYGYVGIVNMRKSLNALLISNSGDVNVERPINNKPYEYWLDEEDN